jgi:hypothetical protein
MYLCCVKLSSHGVFRVALRFCGRTVQSQGTFCYYGQYVIVTRAIQVPEMALQSFASLFGTLRRVVWETDGDIRGCLCIVSIEFHISGVKTCNFKGQILLEIIFCINICNTFIY